MTKYILAAVNNKNYSSTVLVDNINTPNINKLLLPGKTERCVLKLTETIAALNPEAVIMFWQKPLRGEINIETMAAAPTVYKTSYNYNSLVDFLNNRGYAAKISTNPGNSFANGVYAKGLEFIATNGLKTQFLFVHIPVLINEAELKSLAFTLERFFIATLNERIKEDE